MGLRQDLLDPKRDDVLRALGIDPALYERLAAGEAGGLLDQEQRLTLHEALELFCTQRIQGDGWTAQTYLTALRSFEAFMTRKAITHEVSVHRITGSDVAAFSTRLREDGARRHPNSINRDLSIVSAFFGFLVRHGHLRRNPAELADRAVVPEAAPVALTEREQQRLLDLSRRSANAVRNFTILHLTLNTGLRVGEVSRLRWKDIDLRAGRLHVVQGKGKRDRTVPLLPTVVDSLTYYRDQFRRYQLACPGFEDTVFLNSTGSRWGCGMTVNGLELMMRPLLKKLRKGKGCNFHILRHSFAVNLLWRGVHIAVIGALLGHRSFETTNKYLRLGDPAVREALTNAFPEGVLVPAIHRQVDRSHLSKLVQTVFGEEE